MPFSLNDCYAKAGDIKIKNKTDNTERHREKLRHDNDLVFTALIAIIEAQIIKHLARASGDASVSFRLWNVHDNITHIMKDKKTSIQLLTFFTGFWDANTRTHNRCTFEDAGIDPMLTQLRNYFKGVTINDVSNISKSRNHVIELRIPQSTEC